VAEKKSHEELTALLAEAAKKVTVGARYEHYKHQAYKVLALALREEDTEPCVVYEPEYAKGIPFIHTVANWTEQVEVDGKKVNRFTQVS
jgi:hypothetical protein